MDKATKETVTAFARRVLSRSLYVLGGTVAATAAAWALSTSTASADVVSDLRSVVTAAPDLGSPVVAEGKHVVVDLVDHTADAVHTVVTAPVDPRVQQGAQHTVEQVAEHLGVPKAEHVDEVPQVRPGPDVTVPGAEDHVLVDPARTAVVTPDTAAPSATPTAIDPVRQQPNRDVAVPRGSPDTDPTPSAPSRVPTQPVPFGFPSPAQSGHTGTGSFDAQAAGLPFTTPVGTGSAVARAFGAAMVLVPTTPGEQPGVTPD